MGRGRKAKKKDAWFDLGARAIACLAPHQPGVPSSYLCPLCYRWYTEVGQLTLEHAPPAALGGRPLVLTCRECNSAAGAKVDHEMLALERALDFGGGTLVRPARGHLRVGEQMVRADVEAVGDIVQITVVPAANHPDIAQRIAAEFGRRRDEGRWEGSTLTIGLDRGFRHRPALVGWLRAAYLVAFAAEGYRYVLHPHLASVRRQLAEPDVGHLGIFSGITLEMPPSERRLLLADEPAPFRSLLVQMGRHLVFLPRCDDEGDLYQRLAAELTPDRPHETTFMGKPLRWPQAPTHVADLPGVGVL